LKKLAIVIALFTSLLLPTQAQAAQTQLIGSTLTNLDFQGANVAILLSSFPAKGGLYIQQCQEGVAGVRPAICNKAAELWISNERGASFTPTSVIVFKPVGVFTSGTVNVDCTVTKCGLFLRYDHTIRGDFSEDQFLPLTFKPADSNVVVLPTDEISASINSLTISTRDSFLLGYRELVTIVATSKSGAALTIESLAPECTVVNGKLTALTGTGLCSIAVTSAGSPTSAATTVRFPIQLKMGVQVVPNIKAVTASKVGVKTALAKTTNYGEKIKYTTSGRCSITGNTLIRQSDCTITATAAGKKDSYDALKFSFTVKRK